MAATDAQDIEQKWQRIWEERGVFRADPSSRKPRYFNFDGGPFPNGSMHMGHVRTFTLGDVMARYQRMRGREVLYCLEFDAFGLPNELAARDQGVSPAQLTAANIDLISSQMRRLGLSYDWRHVHTTSDPRYYRWTQWLFLRLHEAGLIYRAPADLNWCPACQTTLAHMQVLDGNCWRCDGPVETRALVQWFVRLESYSERLLETLAELDGWSPQTRRLLRGFIAPTWCFEVDFELDGAPAEILTAHTTEKANLAAIDYLAVAPAPRFLEKLLRKAPRAAAVGRFLDEVSATATLRDRRQDGDRERKRERELEGVDTGLQVIHPLTGALLPVFVALYADPHFSTRIEIGSPSVDERDARFAARHGIASWSPASLRWPADKYRRQLHYRVRDWLVSRQRSWGTPIPMVHCPQCGTMPVPRDRLPVRLPADLFDPGRPYELVNHPDFADTSCPACYQPARRETDTLDCYFDVVWCFLACASRLDESFSFRKQDFETWMPVSFFHNGFDSFFYAHLYRFLGRVLYELGLLADPEPIRRYKGHDVILSGGRKMSKHHGNVVAPDEIIERYGADVLRVHVLWSANPSRRVEWSEAKLERAQRFLEAVKTLIFTRAEMFRAARGTGPAAGGRGAALERFTARTVRRTTAFLEEYRLNGCLEELHQLLKNLQDFDRKRLDRDHPDPVMVGSFVHCCRTLLLLLNPFAPHLCEELWEQAGGEELAALTAWPALPADASPAAATRRSTDRHR